MHWSTAAATRKPLHWCERLLTRCSVWSCRFSQMGSMKDKVVFITGGARGIGAETARQLHARGAKLVLTDLDETQLHDLAADLGGDRLLTLVADGRDIDGMHAAASRAIDRFGGIDAVVANAGIATF